MAKIHPFLWFDTKAVEAMTFSVSLFPNSKVLSVQRYGPAGPGPEGSVMTIDVEIDGQRVTGLNGGPHYHLSPAFSFVIDCDGQQEVDYYWDRLIEGGQASQCGWLTDRFGFSWQVVPKQLFETIGGSDAAGRNRAMQAMMGMVKLDVAELERAYRGEVAA